MIRDNHREMEGDKDMDTGDKDKKGDGDKKDENAMDPITMHNNTTQTDIIDITDDTNTPNITNDTYTPDIDTLVDFYHTQAAIAPLAPPAARNASFPSKTTNSIKGVSLTPPLSPNGATCTAPSPAKTTASIFPPPSPGNHPP